MNKGLLFAFIFFVGGLMFTSCEQCMTCEINYTKTNGEQVNEDSPQDCGYSWELDEKEDELKEAYSKYNAVDIDCDR